MTGPWRESPLQNGNGCRYDDRVHVSRNLPFVGVLVTTIPLPNTERHASMCRAWEKWDKDSYSARHCLLDHPIGQGLICSGFKRTVPGTLWESKALTNSLSPSLPRHAAPRTDRRGACSRHCTAGRRQGKSSPCSTKSPVGMIAPPPACSYIHMWNINV